MTAPCHEHSMPDKGAGHNNQRDPNSMPINLKAANARVGRQQQWYTLLNVSYVLPQLPHQHIGKVVVSGPLS